MAEKSVQKKEDVLDDKQIEGSSQKNKKKFPVLNPERQAKMCASKTDDKQKEMIRDLMRKQNMSFKLKKQDKINENSAESTSNQVKEKVRDVSVTSALETSLGQAIRKNVEASDKKEIGKSSQIKLLENSIGYLNVESKEYSDNESGGTLRQRDVVSEKLKRSYRRKTKQNQIAIIDEKTKPEEHHRLGHTRSVNVATGTLSEEGKLDRNNGSKIKKKRNRKKKKKMSSQDESKGEERAVNKNFIMEQPIRKKELFLKSKDINRNPDLSKQENGASTSDYKEEEKIDEATTIISILNYRRNYDKLSIPQKLVYFKLILLNPTVLRKIQSMKKVCQNNELPPDSTVVRVLKKYDFYDIQEKYSEVISQDQRDLYFREFYSEYWELLKLKNDLDPMMKKLNALNKHLKSFTEGSPEYKKIESEIVQEEKKLEKNVSYWEFKYFSEKVKHIKERIEEFDKEGVEESDEENDEENYEENDEESD